MDSYSTRKRHFHYGGASLQIGVPDAGDLRALQENGNISTVYWGKIWPAAVALSRFIAAHPGLVKGRSVLELAAGLGLPGMVAAQYAAEVVISDCEEEAVSLLGQHAVLNGLGTARCRRLDWSALPDDVFETDVLLLSDVNYDPAAFDTLYRVLVRFLENKTVILLSTPQRLMAKPFVERLLPFVAQRDELFVKMEDESAWVSIFVLGGELA